MNLNADDYSSFRNYLRNSCGIELGDNKQYLVSSRLRKLLESHELSDVGDLVYRLQKPNETDLKQQVLDAMTTNETSWFRDSYPFEFLKNDWIPRMQRNGSMRPLRIWCAACSTGQEPYSISMMIEENNQNVPALGRVDASIVATDISQAALQDAKSASFDQFSVMRGLSDNLLQRYFTESSKGQWQLSSRVSSRVDFRLLNLQDSYQALGQFDIVFCRNVLIYFSQELKISILKKIRGQMDAGGLLFLGASESISGVEKEFELFNCSPGLAYIAK